MLEDDYFSGTKLYRDKFMYIYKSLADHLGVVDAYYANIDKHGNLCTIYSNRGWAENVLKKKHYIIESAVVHPDNIHNGFVFCNASPDQQYANELLLDGAVNYDWHHAFAYVEKNATNDGYFCFGFATGKDNYKMNNMVINETRIIRKTIREMQSKLITLTNNFEGCTVDIRSLKGSAYHQQKGVVFNEKQDILFKNELLKELLGAVTCKKLLSKSLAPQEINCLRKYMIGNNVKKVARDLNLAITTVTSYMENIKTKLNCHNKDELLEKATILEAFGYI